MISNFVFEAFLKSLIETVLWCRHQIDIENPHAMVWPLTEETELPGKLTQQEHKQFCEHVVADRAILVRKLNPAPSQDVISLIRQGRLMIFLYHWTTSDGYPQHASRGYFDVNNYPPWDTWVAHIDAYEEQEHRRSEGIMAWVPPEFVSDVNEAIEGCADESIVWLTDWGPNFAYASLFRQARLWI